MLIAAEENHIDVTFLISDSYNSVTGKRIPLYL
jgi:hypothetical protein